MNKILIPSSLIELTGLVQQCLLLAKEQGFIIENVELGVSPTQSIQLIHDQHITSLSTDILSSIDCSQDSDYILYYRSELSVGECRHQESNDIYIGIPDQPLNEVPNSIQLDIWRHPINNEARALSVAPHLAKHLYPELHLAWFVTLSILDFPIEDVLTLARAMMSPTGNVSRETSAFDIRTMSSNHVLKMWAFEFSAFPTPVLEDDRLGIQVGWSANGESVGFPTLAKPSLGLYPVVDDVSWIERLLPMGIKTIQLRIKKPQRADLEQQVEKAIELGRQYDAQVFINDYWQLAIKHGAYGVHLGQEDIEESNLAQLSKAGVHLGLSTHGYYELLRIVQIHPSYIALGHIFPTTTKEMPSKPQGLVRLALYQKLIDTIPYGITKSGTNQQLGFPTVAIGGIDQSNADQVWQCGVSSLAVVRAITLSSDPQLVIDFFANLMGVSQDVLVRKNRNEQRAVCAE
jgi:thiamine-phosphate pyrophosphorylase